MRAVSPRNLFYGQMSSEPGWISEDAIYWELFCDAMHYSPQPNVVQSPQAARAFLDTKRALGHYGTKKQNVFVIDKFKHTDDIVIHVFFIFIF